MAIREIRKIGDDILRKKCRLVDKVDERLLTILDDMKETMYKANGVGLAGPQVGILKRIAVVDIGDGPIDLINPEITEASGTQDGVEGCLSVPDKYGTVERPQKITVRTLNRQGNTIELTVCDFKARAFCHEIDHLDGKLFVDKVKKYIKVDE